MPCTSAYGAEKTAPHMKMANIKTYRQATVASQSHMDTSGYIQKSEM